MGFFDPFKDVKDGVLLGEEDIIVEEGPIEMEQIWELGLVPMYHVTSFTMQMSSYPISTIFVLL